MDVLSIYELNAYLAAVLDSDPVLSDIWVEGEISNASRPSSGHWYWTLKGDNAQIGAVCWKSSAARLTTLPRDGLAVLVHGKVGIFNGKVQVYVDFIRPAGEGILFARFEQLKARLQAEGLFERKRPLPAYPRRIGIVTSPTGAALRDMCHVLARRYPLAEVILAPAQVQGEGAAETVVEALYSLYELDLDVIIVARGGGSIEDLWCFNEEIVARAVFASPVPLVTGVGHETDTTMVDYVSDLRAPTPSVAAELITPDGDMLRASVAGYRAALADMISDRLAAARQQVGQAGLRLERVSPLTRLRVNREQVGLRLERARRSIDTRLQLERLRIAAHGQRLRALSPAATLARGYAVVLRAADQSLVAAPGDVQPGDTLSIQVQGGTFEATVS